MRRPIIHVKIEHVTEEVIPLTFGTGYLGTVFHMQAAMPHPKERGESIFNMGSRMGVYGATKEARGEQQHDSGPRL
jgi:NAD(P)-dependent dehydrogenase (short-subunit alcohol dehydrogenase family)